MKLQEAKETHEKIKKAYAEAILSMNLQEKRIRVKDILLLIHVKEFSEGKSISEIVEYKMSNELIKKDHTDKDKNNFKVKVSKTVKRYSRLGLIECKQDKKDKRTHRIYITQMGNEILKEINIKVEQIWKEKYGN